MSKRAHHVVLATCACLLVAPVCAQDVSWHGYLDTRAVVAPNERSWTEGGLGKLRFGDGGAASARVDSGALIGTAQFTPALMAMIDAQWRNRPEAGISLIEAYLRYRPVSITPWRWSLKLGAFFPPVSLENDAIGWTSRWTLTPSAINSWIGEEFRSVGAELRVEHRGEHRTVDASVAVFQGNDPAGELLAARGWGLGDATSGFGARVREPDVLGLSPPPTAPPLHFDPFEEIDHRIGWYADVSANSPRLGRTTVMRYDNRADPTTSTLYAADHRVFSWRTRFWSVGHAKQFDRISVLAQAIDGDTTFTPSRFFTSTTAFRAAYVLLGWDRGELAPALRVDRFSTRETSRPASDGIDEIGSALTLALNWRPLPQVRVTGEWVHVQSRRDERRLAGLAAQSNDNQWLLNLRLLF